MACYNPLVLSRFFRRSFVLCSHSSGRIHDFRNRTRPGAHAQPGLHFFEHATGLFQLLHVTAHALAHSVHSAPPGQDGSATTISLITTLLNKYYIHIGWIDLSFIHSFLAGMSSAKNSHARSSTVVCMSHGRTDARTHARTHARKAYTHTHTHTHIHTHTLNFTRSYKNLMCIDLM